MFELKWEGRARDYALTVALTGVQSMIGSLMFGSVRDASLAYIDPGVGAMIVQAIAAAFFGALFYFKNLRRALGRFFMKITGREPAPQVAESVAEKK